MLSTIVFILVVVFSYLFYDAIDTWYIKPHEHLKEKYDDLQDSYDLLKCDFYELETEHESLRRSYQATFESLTIHENDIKKLRKELATTKGQLTKLKKKNAEQNNTKAKK